MQLLRGFVYEMKGTRFEGWCVALAPTTTEEDQTSFIRYYCAQYNQTTETRDYSAKRDGKEHLCDYLNRRNGYARNAGIEFDKGGRKARDHVNHFLETCGDRGLERRLCHVKVYDIHELEEMFIEILKVDDRESAKRPSQFRSRSHDTGRSKRSDHPRDGYSRSDRRDRDFGRRRDKSRNISRVTFTEGAKTFAAQKTTIVTIVTMSTMIMITMMDGTLMNRDTLTKKEKKTMILMMRMTLWQRLMK
ncbi:hypothetical protein PHMEG_00019755 [Phytophthora megakarya]|uniref:Uncharacterized protein n=1 Tax=Phytophthora megakarya TaxID=4795 RepID=A0A225VQI8_9STRA|nr:hypothetical protein PHMEG_00019755 [Phytophthora megakarya]